MAYPISPGSLLEFTLLGRANGQRCMSILHYKYTGSTTIADGKLALTNFLANVNVASDLVGRWNDLIAQNCTIDQLRAQWIFPSRFVYETAAPWNNVGLWPDDCQAPNVAATIEKRTERSGRDQRGILHLWGIAAAAQIDGFVAAGYDTKAALLITQLQLVRSITGGVTLAPVIYSRSSPSSSPQIVSCTLPSTLRTMRRRTVGRGV